MRNSSAESPRVPGPGSSSQGKPDPKARLKSVVDGKRVNIPVLFFSSMERRKKVDPPHVGLWFKYVGGEDRQIRFHIL